MPHVRRIGKRAFLINSLGRRNRRPRFAMRTMNRLNLIVMLCMTTSIAFAQESSKKSESVDPTGTWVWEQNFRGTPMKRSLELKLENGKLSGTFSSNFPPNSQPAPISATKVEGDKIWFNVVRQFGGNDFTTKYECVVTKDELGGISEVEFGGRVRETEFIAKRSNATTDEPDDPPSFQTEKVFGAFGAMVEAGRLPVPGSVTDKAYVPQPILPGGVVVPLYATDSPELKQDRVTEAEKYNMTGHAPGRIQSIVNIHNPSIEVHRAGGNTGTCVILAAGGGHRTLNVGSEAADFVPFFYNYGVNCVILRNRLRSDGYVAEVDAVNDALQAIRVVRANAEQWGIHPNRIGIVGFSAGAELSGPAAIQFAAFDESHKDDEGPLSGISSRPDFVGLLYPGPTPFTRDADTSVPRNAPPSFVATPGSGDRIHAIWAMDYFRGMLNASIPNIEMHIYGNGTHGGGMRDRRGIPLGTWQDRFIDWFRDLGFLSDRKTETKAAVDSAAFAADR